MGPRPLGSWSLLCSCPAPPGEGRREESGGCAGRPRAGPVGALAPAQGFLRLSRPGWGCALPEARRTAAVLAQRGPELLGPRLCRSWARGTS